MELASHQAAARSSATSGVRSAFVQLRALLPLVVRNNPNKAFNWAVNRADVKVSVTTARATMIENGAQAIIAAYQSTYVSAQLEAVHTLTELGITPSWAPDQHNEYLDELVKRWRESASAIFTALHGQMGTAVAKVQIKPLLSNDPINGVPNVFQALGMDKQAALEQVIDQAIRALAFRAGVGASTAAARAAGDALTAMAVPPQDGVRLLKRWRVSGLPGTCIHCRQLNGVTIPIDKAFPALGGMPVFGGPLMGPPRHPNCRCYLQIVPEDLVTHAYAQLPLDFPIAGPPPAPITPAVALPPPVLQAPVVVKMSAAQIRAMPRKTYRSVVASLLAVIRSFLGQQWKKGRRWLGS